MPQPIHIDYLAWLIAREYNFIDLEETMYESWLMDEPEVVFRIANTKHASRIHILFDKRIFAE